MKHPAVEWDPNAPTTVYVGEATPANAAFMLLLVMTPREALTRLDTALARRPDFAADPDSQELRRLLQQALVREVRS